MEPVVEQVVSPIEKLDVARYTHVPLYVRAVQVTPENMHTVSRWANATITADDKSRMYIKVATVRPTNDRQTRAYIGDWVLRTDVGLKVYTDVAFKRGFVPAAEETTEPVL